MLDVSGAISKIFIELLAKKNSEHGAISLNTVGIWSQWKPKEGNAGGEKAKTQKTEHITRCNIVANCMHLHVHRKCKKRTRTTEKRKISITEFPMGTVASSGDEKTGFASGKAPKVYVEHPFSTYSCHFSAACMFVCF